MSFSTGVMIYLSFMDIMLETSQSKVGETHASLAFFAGMLAFLLLEVCMPEVEGTQIAEIFGFAAWSPSPVKPVKVDEDLPAATTKRLPSSPSKKSLHHRRASKDDPVDTSDRGAKPSSASTAAAAPRHSWSPLARHPGEEKKEAPKVKRQRSPPPSEKRQLFEASGEESLSNRRKSRHAGA